MATPTSARELFGGAISLPVPKDFIDASDLRQVPDNQEVFLSNNSDTAVIFEILATVEEGGAAQDMYEAAKFHFNSVAHDNAALSSALTTPPPPVHTVPPHTQEVSSASELSTPHPTIVTGIQKVHKFSHDPSGAPRRGHEGDEPDEVWIGLALWRVDVSINGHRKRADLVCTANVPVREAAEGNPAGASSEELAATENWWRHAVADMRINDWNLFGDEN